MADLVMRLRGRLVEWREVERATVRRLWLVGSEACLASERCAAFDRAIVELDRLLAEAATGGGMS